LFHCFFDDSFSESRIVKAYGFSPIAFDKRKVNSPLLARGRLVYLSLPNALEREFVLHYQYLCEFCALPLCCA